MVWNILKHEPFFADDELAEVGPKFHQGGQAPLAPAGAGAAVKYPTIS